MPNDLVCVYSCVTEDDTSLVDYSFESDNDPIPLRAQSRMTRALARWSLQQFWSVPSEQVRFARDQYGAAELWVADQQWSVSFSHTDGCCAVAIARTGNLGIDCERIRERRQRERLQQRFADGFMHGVTSIEQFFERWTAAEAVTKAKRAELMPTLAMPMNDLEPHLHWYRNHEWQFCCYSTVSDQPPQWIEFAKNNHLS